MNRIKVTLKFAHTLHIGTTFRENEVNDQPIIKLKKNGRKEVYVPGNSIRGTLRHIAYNISTVLFPEEKIEDLIKNHYSGFTSTEQYNKYINNPFIGLFGAPQIEGKLRVFDACIVDGHKDDTRIQAGINVDRVLNSVKKNQLFNCEIAEINKIKFEIAPFNLNDNEKALLLSTLNFLRFSKIGGKGNIGCGLVTDVQIENFEFKRDTMGIIKSIFEKLENTRSIETPKEA